jgi:hypothetical protein
MKMSAPAIWFEPIPTAAHMFPVDVEMVKYMSVFESSGRVSPKTRSCVGEMNMDGLVCVGVVLAEDEVELVEEADEEPLVVAVPVERLLLELPVGVVDTLCVLALETELETETVVELVVAWPLT